MRRVRMTVAATVAGATLSLLGTGVASAATGPGATPQQQAANAAAGAAGTEAGNPLSAVATAAGVCSDAAQIGTTEYIYRGTETIASVKQFYSPSCDKNYGYVWAWKSFLDQNINFNLTVGVWAYERNSLVGQRTVFNTHSQEFWGNAADTADECTSADGTINIPADPDPLNARTSKRC
ncbi:MAG TPA: hypothetical protein VN520_04295 [Streptomyces sp.]|uniref:hypothetical protein n=1 Tax=Streptomyces sp. TaxID=1931 RepID=UPI002B587AB0|nr:hypothetical protein [Streptomyces sp.]HWU05612.1 hypothetical protein [Streptomyces sp.]